MSSAVFMAIRACVCPKTDFSTQETGFSQRASLFQSLNSSLLFSSITLSTRFSLIIAATNHPFVRNLVGTIRMILFYVISAHTNFLLSTGSAQPSWTSHFNTSYFPTSKGGRFHSLVFQLSSSQIQSDTFSHWTSAASNSSPDRLVCIAKPEC